MSSPAKLPGKVERAFERWNARFTPVGVLTLALVLVAIVTGVALSAGYDVSRPAESVARLELSSAPGRWCRALHAWSSHLSVALCVLHMVEHLGRGSEQRLRLGLWLRVLLTLPLLLGVALTGFMLRADAEGRLARQMVSGLLERIPAVGHSVAATVLGGGDNLELVYVAHLAILTVPLLLLTIEHARRTWPDANAVLAGAALSLLLAWCVPLGLHPGTSLIVRGPWYFVGLQAILHWLEHPLWLFAWALVPFCLLACLPQLATQWRRRVLGALAATLGLYAVLSVYAYWFRGPTWELSPPWRPVATSAMPPPPWMPLSGGALPAAEIPTILGRPEGCLGCHQGLTGLDPSHDPSTIGCAACHLGNPYAPDAPSAHEGMVRVPGNLDSAAQTCGRGECHGAIVTRVRGSLMATAVGMIAVDQFAFGERSSPDGTVTPAELGSSPADIHLRQLCVSCHLGTGKAAPGAVTDASRGGGCVACHVRDDQSRIPAEGQPDHVPHPRISADVSDDNCFGCHSRSGRISLGYAGWTEAETTPRTARPDGPPRIQTLADGRRLYGATEDVHQKKGMACIDCHSSRELMGDGTPAAHEELATEIRCTTCHRTEPPQTLGAEPRDAETEALARLRGLALDGDTLVADLTSAPLLNARPLPGGAVEIRSKRTGEPWFAQPPARSCSSIRGHERLSCQSCHTSWAHRCVGCHTEWDVTSERVDLLTGERKPGSFVEYDVAAQAADASLGVVTRRGRAEIDLVTPGMVMTLNVESRTAKGALPSAASALVGPRTRSLRAYAFAVPHTTTREARTCRSCHWASEALGYGSGALSLEAEDGHSRVRFTPSHAPSSTDGLPGDAWLGFLADPTTAASTRRGVRPLERDAQLRALQVGACMSCHDPEGSDNRALYEDYARSKANRGPSCRLPEPPP